MYNHFKQVKRGLVSILPRVDYVHWPAVIFMVIILITYSRHVVNESSKELSHTKINNTSRQEREKKLFLFVTPYFWRKLIMLMYIIYQIANSKNHLDIVLHDNKIKRKSAAFLMFPICIFVNQLYLDNGFWETILGYVWFLEIEDFKEALNYM